MQKIQGGKDSKNRKKSHAIRGTLTATVVAMTFLQGIVFPSVALAVNDQSASTYTTEHVDENGDPVVHNTEDEDATAVQTGESFGNSDARNNDAADNIADGTQEDSESSDTADSENDSLSTSADAQPTESPSTDSQQPTDADVDSSDTDIDDADIAAQSDDPQGTTEDTNGPVAPSADYTGWVEYGGEKYWFRNGAMVTRQEIYDSGSKAWYWLDANGVMAHDKDVYLSSNSGKWVRYDSEGHMMYGEDCRYGGWYYFNTTTGAMTKGIALVKTSTGVSKWVYYDVTTGKMKYGQQAVTYDNEHRGWYYFHPTTGAMQYGHVYHAAQNKWVYYHKVTGKMLYGEQCLDGAWYYFNTATGARVTGLTKLPNKTVYYDSNGKMVYGGVLINNKPYYFDTTTGRRWSGTEIANKVVSTARSFKSKHPDCPGALAINGGIVCPYGPCMSFVWYVFHTAGLDVFLCNGGSGTGNGGVPSGYPDHNYTWYANRGRIRTTNPKPGDIVFWRFTNGYSWSTNASHAGIVVAVSNGSVKVVDAAFTDINEREVFSSQYPATPHYATPYYE